MSDFAPSVGAAAAAGIKTTSSPYPANPADGARVSLEEIAKRIREGQSDARIVELAGKILVEAGFNGRGNAAGSTRDRVGALLNWVRGWLLYAPDAPGSERMASAAALACVSKDLCIRIGDCDDQIILTGSLIGAIGVPVRVVKQHFGNQHQEHVLLEAQDDSGGWIYLDPSTDQPLGSAPRAISEVRVDPLDQSIPNVGTGAELITMGKPPNTGVGDACCGSCASGTECQGKMKPELLGVGAGTHGGGGGFHSGGGFHGGGGFQRGIHHRFHQGRWWAWWPDQGGWLVVDGESCNRWGDVITNPPADVYAEAARQLAASNGAPVSEHFGDALYLFTLENGAVVIRSCASTVGYGQTLTERHAHGVAAPPVGVGFCDYDLIKSVRARLAAPWYALNGDVDACPAFPVAQRYAFKGDFDSFVNWYSGALPNDWFCKDAERDEIEQGRDFEARLNNWRKILSSTNCQLSAPDLPPLTQDDPRSRDYKPPEGSDVAGSIKSVLITAGIVGAVGVGVYVTMPLLRAAVESLTEKTKAATRKRALAK